MEKGVPLVDIGLSEVLKSSMQEAINYFPGYEYIPPKIPGEKGKNMYRGIDVGLGGYVYAEPGIYTDIALLDIQSMHPHSAVALNYFGEYTQRFKDILDARIAIKNREFDKVKTMFDGKLAKYVVDDGLADQLATALKLAINSVYGLTSAKFDNVFRDPRNVNNIVALRGALFMKTLQDEVVSKGYSVIAIRTDSIKIANATPDIIQFCMDFAEKYSYNFQHEASYERMCQIDDANYVAAYMGSDKCMNLYGYVPKDNSKHFKKYSHPWTSTGKLFQRPYIFKTLFSGESIDFKDLCVVSQTTKGALYLDKNEGLRDVTSEEKEASRRKNNVVHPDKQQKLNPEYEGMSDENLKELISDGHFYDFVGRVGRFYPVKPGTGGGLLVAYNSETDKYNAATGSKGYRWAEAEVIQSLGLENNYDPRYWDEEAKTMIKAIEKFGSYEKFVDISKPYSPDVKEEPAKEPDDDPPWSTLPPVVPCGDGKFNTCLECPFCKDDICGKGYSLASYVEHGGSGV